MRYVVLALALLALAAPVSASAATRPPVHMPAGTRFQVIKHLSNTADDYNWGFSPSSGAFFHQQTQTNLHRLAGWASTAKWNHLDHQITWTVVYSTYQTDSAHQYSTAALQDFQTTAVTAGFTPSSTVPPMGTVDSSLYMTFQRQQVHGVLVGVTRGDVEIEAVELNDGVTPHMRIIGANALIRLLRHALAIGTP